MEDHRRYEEDLAAHMLGALGPEEQRSLTAHLESCASCRAEERWLRSAVEMLPGSVEQVEPPPELKRRLMATVMAEANGERPEPAKRRRRLVFPGGMTLRPALALGTVLAAITGAGIGGYLLAEGDGGDTKTVVVRASPADPDARATIVGGNDSAVLRVKGLDPQPRGHAYRVWLRHDGSEQAVPSSVFLVGRDGRGAAAIPGGLDGVAEVMVTAEPGADTTSPSGKPVLRTTL